MARLRSPLCLSRVSHRRYDAAVWAFVHLNLHLFWRVPARKRRHHPDDLGLSHEHRLEPATRSLWERVFKLLTTMLDLHNLPNPVPNEEVVFFLRRHPITLLGLFFGFFFLMIAPFAIWSILATFQPEVLEDPVSFTLLLMGGSAFFLFAWLFLFQAFLDYYLDTWIVTTKRILNIEQTGLFGRTVSELRLYRIQDVTAVVNGISNTFFNYGEVEIQTAGEKEHFVFEQVSNPNNISKVILELSEKDRSEHLEDAVEDFGLKDRVNKKKTA